MDPISAIIYLIVSIAISIALAPKIEPEPPSEEDIQFPVADEATKIPVVYGTVLMEGSNVVWGGDFNKKKIKKSSLFSSQTVGYKIYYGLSHALCWGRTKLVRVLFNDKVGWDSLEDEGLNDVGEGQYFVNQTTLFSRGGNSTISNGVSGDIYFYEGNETQLANDYIQNYEQVEMPRYKNLSYIVFGSENTDLIEKGPYLIKVPRKFYWGNSTQISKVSFVLRNIPEGLDPFFGNINNQANPISIMYDIMTEKEKYGLAIPEGEIDFGSFISAAATLYFEGFGINLIVRDSSFEDIKRDIEKHVSCYFYKDIFDNKWKVKLLRDDYVKENLPIFNEDNIVELKNVEKPQIDDLYNEVKVIYKDINENFKEKTATAYNNAMFFNRNFNNSNTVKYLAVGDIDLANKIAQRDLDVLGKPLISCRMKCNRDGFNLNLGDAIVVDFPEYEINSRVFRVREVDLGEYNSNIITVELTEDTFQYGRIVSDNSKQTDWREPIAEVYPNNDKLVLEAPYIFGNNNQILVGNTQKTSFNDSFILIDNDFESEDNFLVENEREFFSEGTTPYSTLSLPLAIYQQNIEINNGVTDFANELNELSNSTDSLIKQFNNIMYIDNGVGTDGEFIGFNTVFYNNGTDKYEITSLKRGLLDTLPKAHNAGSRVFFISNGYVSPDMFSNNPTFSVLYIDLNGKQTPSFQQTIPIVGNRNKLPLPPASIRINSQYYPSSIGFVDLQLDWEHRDKNLTEIRFFEEIGVQSLPSGKTYTLKIYDQTDTLIKTETGLTTNTYTFTDEIAISGSYNTQLRVELFSVDSFGNSLETFNYTIQRA